MKKVFSLLITLAMLISTAVVPMSVSADADVWDGTTTDTNWATDESGAYLITTAAELAGLAKTIADADENSTTFVAPSLNSGMYNAYTGVYFKLTTDINLDVLGSASFVVEGILTATDNTAKTKDITKVGISARNADATGTIIVALYDTSNRFIKAVTVDVAMVVARDNGLSADIGFDTVSSTSKYIVKVFVWDSVNGVTPLSLIYKTNI